MPLPGSSPSKPGSWPMSVGAAGIAAAQLARCGFDVLIQTGHDKPWYDLAVTKAGNLLKIAVKASDNGCWCLVQSYLKRSGHASGSQADGNRAIDLWLDIHGARIAYCLVQFEGVSLDQMPRIYMATPAEIAQEMRAASARLGDPVLREQYEWRTAETGSLSAEALPSNWRFSPRGSRNWYSLHREQPSPCRRCAAALRPWSCARSRLKRRASRCGKRFCPRDAGILTGRRFRIQGADGGERHVFLEGSGFVNPHQDSHHARQVNPDHEKHSIASVHQNSLPDPGNSARCG